MRSSRVRSGPSSIVPYMRGPLPPECATGGPAGAAMLLDTRSVPPESALGVPLGASKEAGICRSGGVISACVTGATGCGWWCGGAWAAAGPHVCAGCALGAGPAIRAGACAAAAGYAGAAGGTCMNRERRTMPCPSMGPGAAWCVLGPWPGGLPAGWGEPRPRCGLGAADGPRRLFSKFLHNEKGQIY